MNSKKQKEEERRRKAAAVVPVVKKAAAAPAVSNAVKQGAAYRNPMTASTTKAVPVVKSAKNTAAKPAAQQSTTQSRGLKMLPVIGKGTQNTQTTAARPVVTPVKQHRTDQRDLQMNMLAWHQTSDPAKRAALHTANDAIRARHGYTYRNGVTRDRQGRNLSAPVTMLTGGSRGAAAQTRQAAAPIVAKAEIDRDAEARRQASYDRQTPLSVLGHNAMAGVLGINKGLYSTLDFLLPDVITPKPVQDWIDRSKTDADDIIERVNRYNYERGGAAGAFLGSAFQSGIQMVPQAVLAVLSGGTSETAQAATAIGNVGKSAVRKVVEAMGKNPSYWTSFAQTVGSDYEDAKAGGASDTQAAVSAILSSAVNAGIEVGGGLETLADNPNTIRQWLKSAGEEGAEEVKQGIVTGLAQKGVYDHGKPWLTAGSGEGVVDPVRAAQEYGAGALVGGVVGAPRMLGGVRGQAQAETQTRTSVSPEAEQNYRQQIDGVFDGSLPSNRLIDLGNTPEVLRALGANNIPLRMTQEVARKIAYPENYLGGKHNLGISALKNLLPQINDPLAVLRSNTQGNSLVLLTQWNDANNNPVIAAVHLNKQGIADDVNVVASAYGKRNIDALLGENGQNIIYTKENKSINQLLDNRLQLPELVADDTLVDYSIRRDAGNSNGSAENSANIMQNTPEGALELLTQTLVKIDGLMRQADALPEGEIKQQRKAELQESARQVSRQLSQIENNRAEFAQAKAIAERLGAKFELAALGPAGGKYENGTITVNPYAQSPVRQVLVHELTHHLETSGQYADLQRAAIAAFSAETGVDADTLRANIVTLYGRNGVALDYDGASRELAAAYCENRLFQDENSIRRLAQTDLNLFQRIRQWISDMVIRLRGTEEQKRVLEVQRLYEKAASELGVQEGKTGAQYTFSREADAMTLMQAEQMEREGASRDDIWRALGVIRDTKGNWVSEIDDSAARIRLAGMRSTLGDTMQHDALYQRVPGLQDTGVIVEPGYMTQNGYFDPADNAIHLNRKLIGAPEQTLLHETQHRVQQAEGRPNGASAEYWAGAENPGELYRNTAGEIEARESASRRNMTAEERRQKTPDLGWDRAVFAEDAGQSMEIKTDTEGEKYVDVNTDNMTGVPYKDVPNALAEIVHEKFSDPVNANGQDIFISTRTSREWSRSEYSKRLGRDKPRRYTDKMNAFSQADELLTASRDYIGEALKHERHDNFVEFARGKVKFKVGENGYLADIVVGITDKQEPVLYDIVKLRNIKIAETLNTTPVTEVNRRRGSVPATESIAPDGAKSNTFGFTPEQIAKGAVALGELMQYGKTPEQAAMEARARREGMAKRAARELYRNVVSGQAEMERFAKMQKQENPNLPDANDLAQMNRVAGSTVDTIAEKALVDRKGDAIGKGWLETVGGLDREQLEELNLYRLHEHNIDRMSLRERTESARAEAKKDYEAFLRENPKFLTMTESRMRYLEHKGTPREQSLIREYHDLKNELDHWEQIKDKPVLAKKDPNKTQDIAYTAKESERILREMEERNPMLPQWAAEAEDFHDKFMREWAIGSGLMSEAQYEMLKERYPHYVQTYRVRDQWGGGTDTTRRGSVNTGSPIKDAVGDITKIVPFEDAEMMQVNSIVKNARRNELFRNIYEFTEAHPKEAAAYVRIVSKDADADAAPITSFDDLTGDMADAAMSDQGGIYTIRAMVDGKPITMQVNSAFYAGLQNLFGQDRGASDSFMKKTFGTMTNAFKLFTTGKNPLFFLTNLPKDFQTAYINTTSSRKTLLTWLYDVGQTVKHMAKNDADWQAFQALGGAGGGYYHNEKGFTRSAADAGKHSVIKKIWAPIDAISENTEALWRFNEYRAAVQRYGDTEAGRAKAIQAAADVTTNFSRTAPATKAAENYCAYLNASVQGLDKIARQVKEHPILTARRAAEIIALPTLLLYLINRDDDNYKNLNNRTKDNYYCIPIGGGDFLKIPKSREYGVAMGALLERFFRLGEGEEADSAFKGIGEQFMTNLAPSNPVTDNILKTVFIDLPTNRDFAGRSIVPERMEGLSPENQYDYTTSGAGMALAKGWNATLGHALGKVSPMQMDYLIDSNLGFVGDAIIGATTDPKSPGELAKSLAEHPVKTVLLPVFNTVKQKFTANPLYQNGVTDAFYDELDAAKRAANDKNLVENLDADIVTPEEKYYSALNKSSGEISDLRKQERAILADKSLDDEEREKQVREIRQQILDIAKGAKAKAQAEREEYEKTYVPELSPLSEARQADGREAMRHGVTAQQFAQWNGRLKELTNEKGGDGKKVRSEAVARRETLQEVLDDKTLSDSEKQAVADYVLISTMGDSEREDWETTVKGKVNAIDYVRFRSDVAEYKKEYKGTGADNVANVTAILRGYEGLTDEQRDVLMSTYTGAAKNNTYHESAYEKKLKDNSLYQNMSDGERSKVRSYCNEYEQAVSEGKELDGWKAKAYMAKEAGIAPETYALFYTALSAINEDGGTAKNEEITQAVKLVPGLTDHQRAYLWQAAYGKESTKSNPWGAASVTKYESGKDKAVNPVEGGTLSSSFGPRSAPKAGASTWHKAVDIAAAAGTPVRATLPGKIVAVNRSGWGGGYGVSVRVEHADGVVTEYHHMQEGSVDGLNVGDEVEAGQQIGKVGSTGNSTGPHLDLQAWKDGKIVDPLTVIPGYGEASGYVYDGTVSSGVIAGGQAAAASSRSGGGSGSGSGGLKKLDTMDTLRSLW